MRAALHKLLEIAFFKNTQFLALEPGFRPGFHAIFCAPGRPFRLREGSETVAPQGEWDSGFRHYAVSPDFHLCH
jgi:hypothetical protein